jgi:hypothetical protein
VNKYLEKVGHITGGHHWSWTPSGWDWKSSYIINAAARPILEKIAGAVADQVRYGIAHIPGGLKYSIESKISALSISEKKNILRHVGSTPVSDIGPISRVRDVVDATLRSANKIKKVVH